MHRLILIPGSAVVIEGNEVRPDQRYLSRILGALDLYDPDSILVISGGVYTPTEAHVARDYLIGKAVDPNRIIICEEARDTYQNARDFRKATSGFSSSEYHLITNKFHGLRALLACLLFGIRPIIHTTEELLRKRYQPLIDAGHYSKEQIDEIIMDVCEMKPGESKTEIIGLVAYIIDYLLSFGGRTGFHPANRLISGILGYNKRDPVSPPKSDEWERRLYRYDLQHLEKNLSEI